MDKLSTVLDTAREVIGEINNQEVLETFENKIAVAKMYCDNGDSAVQQNMITDNLEPDMY